MYKNIKVCAISTAILLCDISIATAYTEEELDYLAEECVTQRALQQQFSGGVLIWYDDIILGTGDNCLDIVKQGIIILHGTAIKEILDKAMACQIVLHDLVNANGGIHALPLPDHVEQQYAEYTIDGQTCSEIRKEIGAATN